MQSTGHTSTHERSLTLMQGSAMTYVMMRAPPRWSHGTAAPCGPLRAARNARDHNVASFLRGRPCDNANRKSRVWANLHGSRVCRHLSLEDALLCARMTSYVKRQPPIVGCEIFARGNRRRSCPVWCRRGRGAGPRSPSGNYKLGAPAFLRAGAVAVSDGQAAPWGDRPAGARSRVVRTARDRHGTRPGLRDGARPVPRRADNPPPRSLLTRSSCAGRLIEPDRPGKAVQQEMEVNQPGIGRPARQRADYAVRVERPPQRQPPGQVVSCSDVIDGKDVEAAQAAQQHVLRRPAPDPAQLFQMRDGGDIIEFFDSFEIDSPGSRHLGQTQNGVGLVPAEPKAPEGRRTSGGQIAGSRKRVSLAITATEGGSVPVRQSIKKDDADRERELLARDRVDETFEHRRKSRWLESPKPLRQPPELAVARGASVKAVQIDAQAQHAFYRRAHGPLHGRSEADPACHHAQPRRVGVALLGHTDLDGPTAQHEHPSIDTAVPSVHEIVRPPPQGPRGQVEPERPYRREDDLETAQRDPLPTVVSDMPPSHPNING